MLSVFVVSSVISFAFYLIMLKSLPLETVRTMMTVFLCLESLFLVFAVRSFKRGIIRLDIFSNHILTSAVVISFGMVLAAVYVPLLQTTLHTVPLSLTEWALIVGANIAEVLILDSLKLFFFKKHREGRMRTWVAHT
jgi:Ca2+-transporting ATPase